MVDVVDNNKVNNAINNLMSYYYKGKSMVSKEKSFIDIYGPLKYLINNKESEIYAKEVFRAFTPKNKVESMMGSATITKTHPRAS